MSETTKEFYDRIYCGLYNVLVWPNAKVKQDLSGDKRLRPKRWSREQARQYVQYLEMEELEI